LTLHRYDARTDSNQAEIVRNINRIPTCKVIDLSGVGGGCPDILIQQKVAGVVRFHLVELKVGKGELNPKQVIFHDDHYCHTARSRDDIWKILDL